MATAMATATAMVTATATEEKWCVDGVRDGGDGSDGDGMATAYVSSSSAKITNKNIRRGKLTWNDRQLQQTAILELFWI